MPESWLDLAPDTEFGLATLPYGVFSTNTEGSDRRTGVAIGSTWVRPRAPWEPPSPIWSAAPPWTRLWGPDARSGTRYEELCRPG